MYKPDFATKHKIVHEIFEEYDDINERYHRYNNPESVILKIAHFIDINRNFSSEDELREQIERCLEVDHNPIIGSQYFSAFSLECFQTYRAGLFRACVMLTQAVSEGLIRFVATRNQIQIKKREKALSILKKLICQKLITDKAEEAAKAILNESDRNELHHMNSEISKIEDWHQHAKQHLRNLTTIEYWVFGYNFKEGIPYPHYPQHWDSGDDENTIIVDLRSVIP